MLRDLANRKPDYPMIHVLISNALLSMDPVDYPKVLDELQFAEAADPSDADIYYLRAKVYLATHRNEEARSALLRSIELGPMNPEPYYRLGQLSLKMGKPEEANEAFARMHVVKAATSK